MSTSLVGAAAIALLGLALLFLAVRARRLRGLGFGETVALDNVTLYSPRHKLVGRPDRIVKQGNAYIPEEWKSARRVSHGHRLQLGTYFILIEEEYGIAPPFGVVVLADGTRVKVPNTDILRQEVLSVAQRIRESRTKLAEPIPVSQPLSKCRRCGQRTNCSQARK